MQRLVAVLLLVAAIGGYYGPARAADGEREALIASFDRIAPSVGPMYALDSGGNFNFLCSATAVDRYEGQTVILTAFHCLKKGVSYLINFGDNTLRPLTVWKVPHYEADPEDVRAYGEPETDMALFLMEGTDIPIMPLSDTDATDYGQGVAMVGYPLGVAKIAYEGMVAGAFDRPNHDVDGYTLLQIFGAPGSSGSSVIDIETGEVVAVLVAGRDAGVGLPVIFATPISYRKWLAEIAPEAEVGEEVAESEEPQAP